LTSALTVLDPAASTGKLTRLLIPALDRVVTVEPQEAMRRVFGALCTEGEVFAGIAEQIPLNACFCRCRLCR
jgi:hypothetical protein